MTSTIEKCFSLTAAFEGGGYAALTGDFDGAGLSWGFLQWNIGSHTLQPLLLEMYAKQPTKFHEACTVPVQAAPFNGKAVDLTAQLIEECKRTVPDALTWIRQRQTGDHRLLPHWKMVFDRLASVPEFDAIQREHAHAGYMAPALAYAKQLGFKSERGLALCFDICVQMGSISGQSMARYHASTDGRQMDEANKLVALAHAVGPQAGRWEADVLSRKLCIATGSGTVHGRTYNIEGDFGITMAPVA